MQDAFKAVHNDYRTRTSCAGRVQRLEQQTKKYLPSSTIKWVVLRDQRMKASTRVTRAQTTTHADASTQPQSPQMDEDARRDSVINYNLVGRKGAVFVKAEYPGKAIKDNQRIADGIHCALDCIRKLELPCPASIVISDNASVMQSALALLDTDQKYAADHYVTKVGCCIHACNLLYKDISNLPSMKKPTESGRGFFAVASVQQAF